MKKELSIPELIRHMNHDFLNKLNLIQMYIDLGKSEECKKIIQDITNECKKISNIHQLKCPKLITWIDTFSYCFSAISFHLNSNVKNAIPIELDEKIRDYLNRTIEHVYNELDPYVEQNLTLTVESNDEKFEIHFDLKGNWNALKFNTKEDEPFAIETYEETNQSWKYVIRSK